MAEPTLTHPAFHRKALLLTLLTRARQHLDCISFAADRHYASPGCAEVLGQAVQMSRVLREMEALLEQALDI
jgi:hypothetical protein